MNSLAVRTIADTRTSGPQIDTSTHPGKRETYWQLLYYYARRRGHGVDEAEDLIQGFFLRLLEKGAMGKADRNRGRFRTFLLSSLKNYITDEWEKGKAAKRGGGRAFHSLDFESIENLCQQDSLQESSPDVVFARRWEA